jgi:O-antigen/teichoic acid export membrane protein
MGPGTDSELMSRETSLVPASAPADATAEPGGNAPAGAGDATVVSPWRSVVRSAGARALVIPVSALLGVINTRVIIDNFGQAAYAQYGLLVAVAALLPFTDLGMSAAIMNATGGSEHPSRDDHVRRVLITSIRVLVGSGAVLLVAVFVISGLGLWPALMGDGLLPGSGPRAAASCLALIALTLPIAFGQRVLTGLGKNHVTVLLNGLQTPIVLLVIVLMVRLDLGAGSYVAVVAYVATMALALAATLVAARLIRPAIGAAVRAVPKIRTVPGAKVLDVAWPMLILMTVLPIVNQSDRLVLSHVSDSANLATYNLAAQMYVPVWAVTTAGGIALWPIFARARARGHRTRQSPLALAAGFAAAAAAICLGISLLAPWLARLASGGRIDLPISILAAFSALMVSQAANYPLGMYMTDAAGLRSQAFRVVAMMPVNLGLSLTLGARYGAVGPVIGSAIGVFLFEVVGNWIYVRRRLAPGL